MNVITRTQPKYKMEMTDKWMQRKSIVNGMNTNKTKYKMQGCGASSPPGHTPKSHLAQCQQGLEGKW